MNIGGGADGGAGSLARYAEAWGREHPSHRRCVRRHAPSRLPVAGIGKAGIRNLTLALFDSFKDRGVHIATVTVAAFVDPESREATDVAEAFWNLHNQPRESWTAEVRYEG